MRLACRLQATNCVDNYHGAITLNAMMITAIVDGELPIDTLDQLVSLR